ncbi:LysM domain-containing protein [Curtobacterium sp. MCPF17_001]|uniref:LysM domain-containing protein n=1 Tax=Curtobacterium sp. MCPF17_001 TaxID=2175651 RepID=UPI000DA7F9ED|nr:LysM domain-containing protein [Curtobacterium sp. MCPF17_001]PZE58405.1 LysM domain-containing protein [Curtobacterium sp. MCPF17_001]
MHHGDGLQGNSRRLTAALVLAVVVTTATAGCSLLRGPDEFPAPQRSSASAAPRTPQADPSASAEARRISESASPRTPTAVPTEAAAPDPTVSPIPVGSVLSEADVVSPKGSVRFHYRVVVGADGTPTAQWTGFASTLPVPVATTFLETPPSVGDGITWHGVGDTTLGGGPGAAAAPASTALDPGRADPSWLGTIVVYSAAASASPDLPVEIGPGKVLAVQPVRWSVPSRTTNVHPVDGGARPNATGKSSSEGSTDGAPTAYRIASEDLIGAVANRFGLSVKDLVWLNPDVTVYGDQQYLYEDTVLNLDPFRR